MSISPLTAQAGKGSPVCGISSKTPKGKHMLILSVIYIQFPVRHNFMPELKMFYIIPGSQLESNNRPLR
jgi:hypothetical protein